MISFLLATLFSNISAQRFPFTTIGVKDGLPQSSIFKILQDPQGYIWMGTEAGLCRYDGYKFITYSIHSGIGAKFISDIKLDPQNRLWIASMGKGISWFDGKAFHRFDQTNGLPTNQVRVMEFTNKGDLIIGTLDTGVVLLSKNAKPRFLNYSNGDLVKRIWKLVRVKNGDVLGAGSDGIVRFSANNDFQPELIYESKLVLLSICETEEGDIWAGGVNELIQIHQNKIIDRNELVRLKDWDVRIWDIFEPKSQKSLYIATNKGLLILKDSTKKWLTTMNGLPYDEIRDSYMDNYGNFWIGTYGGGAAILDSKGLDHFDLSSEVFNLPTFSLVDDQRGRIWLGTDSHGYFIYDGKEVHKHPDPLLNESTQLFAAAINPVTGELLMAGMSGMLVKIKDGKVIWNFQAPHTEEYVFLGISFLKDGTAIITSQTGAYKLGINDKQPIHINELGNYYFRSSFIDENGDTWLLGDEGFIFKWKDGRAENLTKIINPNESALEQGVYDKFHKLWWFCSADGLIVYDGRGKYLFHSGNGLKSDSPWSITQDSTGKIWVGHEKGIECIDPDEKKITFIGYDQGFTPVETNSCAAMTDSKGDVWFGTISSASRVRIHDMKADDRTGKLRIQQVLIGKKPVYEELYGDSACPNLTLNFDENTINIEMAALCYSNSRDVRYSWFMENYDVEWITDNEHREALYTNVPPGNYIFHAKAVEPNGYQTNEVVIKITIRRPFWHRPWFYITEFTILAIFIFLSFRFSSNPHQNKLGSFMTLLTILIIFESLLIYLSTYINQFTGGVPVFQLVMNVILAATLNPLEHFIQNIMRRWAIKEVRKKSSHSKKKE